MKKSIKFFLLFASIIYGMHSSSASICKSIIKGTETLSSALSCTDKIVVDGGILYLEAALTISNNLEVKNGGQVIIQKGGSLTIIKGNELIIEAGMFHANGHVSIDQNIQILKGSVFTINGHYRLDVAKELIVDNSKIDLYGNVKVGKRFEFTGKSIVTVSGIFDFNGSDDCKVNNGAEMTLLYGAELNMNGSGKFIFEGKTSKLLINPGAYFLLSEAELKDGLVLNNGYIEQTSSSNQLKINISVIGKGVFYVKKKSRLKLSKGVKVQGHTNGSLSNDFFVLGSDTLSVLRLPMFKIDKSGLILGDSLRIEDSLNLNGERIDISTFDFRMPKSQSFNRSGGNSEYIQTTSTGKYKFKMVKNNEQYIAPIGRNPYLPITAECANCAGVEIAVSVSEYIHENPETKANPQTANAVNETWSIVPQSTISGTVTFQLQWNAGANGTVNSELPGFVRSSCSAVYWVDGASTSWAEDGTNINVSASGSDPYAVTVTLNGMIAGTEYYFGIKSGESPLPIELVTFEAMIKTDVVELLWVTAMEENNDYFSIERSINGVNWQVLAELDGAGNSIVQQYYSWVDQFPEKGRSYYRIRQFDFDGTNSVSDIRNVVLEDDVNTNLAFSALYPSPIKSDLTMVLQGTSGRVVVEITNLSGKTIRTDIINVQSGTNIFNLDLSGLESGAYLLRLVSNSDSICQKVIKE